MTPINNSDTAWLITADYNQENNLYHEELREDIYNPEINGWSYEYYINLGLLVGSVVGSNDFVGGRGNGAIVGRVTGVSGRLYVGGLGNSFLVGGNHYEIII